MKNSSITNRRVMQICVGKQTLLSGFWAVHLSVPYEVLASSLFQVLYSKVLKTKKQNQEPLGDESIICEKVFSLILVNQQLTYTSVHKPYLLWRFWRLTFYFISLH